MPRAGGSLLPLGKAASVVGLPIPRIVPLPCLQGRRQGQPSSMGSAVSRATELFPHSDGLATTRGDEFEPSPTLLAEASSLEGLLLAPPGALHTGPSQQTG